MLQGVDSHPHTAILSNLVHQIWHPEIDQEHLFSSTFYILSQTQASGGIALDFLQYCYSNQLWKDIIWFHHSSMTLVFKVAQHILCGEKSDDDAGTGQIHTSLLLFFHAVVPNNLQSYTGCDTLGTQHSL